MNRKKMLAALLCAAMAVSLLTACGGKDQQSEGSGASADSGTEETEEEAVPMEEETASGDEKGGEAQTGIPMGNASGFIMDLPAGYRYDDAWSCYSSDAAGVRIWLPDANFFDTENEFSSLLEEHEDKKELELDGVIFGWTYEDPAGFNGAETHYCISLGEYYQEKSGCHLLVSSESGDMASTQSQEIIDALKTIRREGEAAGERAEAVAQMNADPYESLVIDFTPEETAAMSTFMSGGFYTVDGDSVFGEVYSTDGTPEFARLDLVQNGSFADVEKHTVLEKGVVPQYVTVYGDDVYYIHGGDNGSGLYRVPKEGGTPELLIEDAAAYLQIRGDKLYYSDSNYTFRKAELDGSKSEAVLDKEIYYPYFVNDQWLLYQDDADDESLHLCHVLSGTDVVLSLVPGYSPVIFGTDLYFKASSNGEKTLAKMDMTYEPDSMDNFSVEYGELQEAGDITISKDGALYYGLTDGLSIDRWKDAENPEEKYEKFYRYLGEKYEIYWEFDDQGRNAGIFVTLLSEGGSQSLGRFD